jgi:hypothetical protein
MSQHGAEYAHYRNVCGSPNAETLYNSPTRPGSPSYIPSSPKSPNTPKQIHSKILSPNYDKIQFAEGKSSLSPRTPNSPISPQSPKLPLSPRSPQSPQSTKSPRSPRSPRSPNTWRYPNSRIDDSYLYDSPNVEVKQDESIFKQIDETKLLMKEQFNRAPNYNPFTGRKIKIGGNTYRKLSKEIGAPTSRTRASPEVRKQRPFNISYCTKFMENPNNSPVNGREMIVGSKAFNMWSEKCGLPDPSKIDEDLNITLNQCAEFFNNPTYNPITNRPVRKDGPTYRKLITKCSLLQD